MAGPIVSEDGDWLWNGSEWIPNRKSSTQSINVSDSVVMGNISQVYNDDKAIQIIALQSIFESKLLELKNQIKKIDLVEIINQICSILKLFESDGKMEILDSKFSRNDRMNLVEEILRIILISKKLIKSSNDFVELRRRFVDYHDVLLRFIRLNRKDLQDYIPIYQIHFSSLSFSLECYRQQIKSLSDKNSIEFISNNVIKLLDKHSRIIPKNFSTHNIVFSDEIMSCISEQIHFFKSEISAKINSLSILLIVLAIVPVLIGTVFSNALNSSFETSKFIFMFFVGSLAMLLIGVVWTEGFRMRKLTAINQKINLEKVTNDF